MRNSISRRGISPEALVLLIYTGIALINYITVLRTGFYTGDFLWARPGLSGAELFLNFLYTVLPLVFAFVLYKSYNNLPKKRKITIPLKALGVYLLIAYPVGIFTSIRYGVGLFGGDGTYNVPIWLRLIIVFTNRLSPGFGTCLYCLSASKKNKLKYLFIPFDIALGLSRASLGSSFQMLVIYILMKYDGKFMRYIKKAIPLLAALLVLILFVGYDLYNFREKLRRGGDTDTITATLSPERLIFGRIFGRLSQYSGSSMLLEDKDTYKPLVKKNISWYEFPLEAIPIPMPNVEFRYGHVLVGTTGNSFSSPGASGVMTIGYYHSGHALFINIITLIILPALVFQLSLLFIDQKTRVVFLLFIYGGLVEGSARALGNAVQYTLMYIFFFLVINFFSRWLRA